MSAAKVANETAPLARVAANKKTFDRARTPGNAIARHAQAPSTIPASAPFSFESVARPVKIPAPRISEQQGPTSLPPARIRFQAASPTASAARINASAGTSDMARRACMA